MKYLLLPLIIFLAPSSTPYVEPPYLLLIGEQIILSDSSGICKPIDMPELFTVLNEDETLRFQLGLALGRHYNP